MDQFTKEKSLLMLVWFKELDEDEQETYREKYLTTQRLAKHTQESLANALKNQEKDAAKDFLKKTMSVADSWIEIYAALKDSSHDKEGVTKQDYAQW